MGAHPKCAAYADELERQFWDKVRRGEFDEWGYTPAEQRARTKRLQSEGRLF